jgi:hypothetical protein
MASTDTAIAGIKYLLFAFNFLIWSFGGGLLAIGIWIRADGGLWEYMQALDIGRYYSACYLIIAAGALLLIIGFVGCLGAAAESPCMLLGYCAGTMLCIVLEIAACVLVWKIAGGDALEQTLSDQIMDHIEIRNTEDKSRRFLDLIQLKLECCGAKTFVDYREIGQDIPLSCNSDRTNNVHIRSCGEMLRRYLEIRGAYVGGICIGLLMLQIMTIVFNCCLFFALQQEDKMLIRE